MKSPVRDSLSSRRTHIPDRLSRTIRLDLPGVMPGLFLHWPRSWPFSSLRLQQQRSGEPGSSRRGDFIADVFRFFLNKACLRLILDRTPLASSIHHVISLNTLMLLYRLHSFRRRTTRSTAQLRPTSFSWRKYPVELTSINKDELSAMCQRLFKHLYE